MEKIIINTAKEITIEEKGILKNIFREEGIDVKINASFMRFSEAEILPLMMEFSLKVLLANIAYDALKIIIKKILSDKGLRKEKEIIMIEREEAFIISNKGFYFRSRKKSIKFSNLDELFKNLPKKVKTKEKEEN